LFCGCVAVGWSGSFGTCSRPRRGAIGSGITLRSGSLRPVGSRPLCAVVRRPVTIPNTSAGPSGRRLASDGSAETVHSAIASWLGDAKRGPIGRWKGGASGGAARSFLPHVRRFDRELGRKLVAEVTVRDLEAFVDTPAAPATRNRALTIVRTFFAWARHSGLVKGDPTDGLTKEREAIRTRVLTEDEIRILLAGFDATRYGRPVRFLFLTGLRRDEVLGLQWSWIDMGRGIVILLPEAEKTGRTREELRRVALSRQAVELLAAQRSALFAEGIRSEFVFATTTGERPHSDSLKPILYGLRGRRSNGLPASRDKRAKKRARVLPDDVTIHDIRRTVADALLNRIGAAPWIVDHVILGHARPKLLRTYMPTLPLGEARDALQKWGDELAAILERAPSLRRALPEAHTLPL